MTDQDALLQRRIFNWSQGLPEWQRGLMRKLCDGPLDEAGRAEVLTVLSAEAGAPTLPPLELANLPADEAEHGTVETDGRLCRRVCRLAEVGEVLHDVFDPGKAEAPQTAEFVLAVDGSERLLEVDLNAEAPRAASGWRRYRAS